MCIWILFTSAKFILNWNLIIILYSLFSSFQEYYKVLEEADEKVQLANQIYDLVRISGWPGHIKLFLGLSSYS